MAASMGAFFNGGAGKTLRASESEVMIHPTVWVVLQGQATGIQIVAEKILQTKKKLNEILAANTGPALRGHLPRYGTRQLR